MWPKCTRWSWPTSRPVSRCCCCVRACGERLLTLCLLFAATAEEAKALVGRALDRVPDDELQRVLDQLASCMRVKSQAAEEQQ